MKLEVKKVWVVYRIDHLKVGKESFRVLKYEQHFESEKAAFAHMKHSLELFQGAAVVLPVYSTNGV